ncbi:hypothetical protein Pla108_18600 [Botrimarina colliarenosi]|uniref:Lipoprotein n=1 Tax=Botrimarina colliarenosi TaxID=2528001 RepID=A0A5C6AEG7_9BACT|nr:hypothetical protein [Botrimarina colliarenosi]TWT97708.1 hypothetical protein Pla108_18600 [Botrimarina colliarenosi]
MFRVFLTAAGLALLAGIAEAQTIIDVPPAVAPTSIGADTVLNLFDGGELPADFQANAGSIVNIAGGVVGPRFDANDMSVVNISGGRVGPFVARDGSTVNISGGTFADFGFFTENLSNVTFAGGDFRIDDQLIAGLGGPGSTTPLTIPGDAISGVTFSGTLADGTPFAFSRQESGSRLGGMLTLRAVGLPAIGPAVITASTDTIPLGIRSGQTMVVDDGGVLPADFNAGWGSTVEIREGGVVGRNLEATGATINMTGGESLGDLEVFYGGVLNMSGGVLNPSNDIFSGGVANISGGMVPQIYVWRDAELHLSGDTLVSQVNLAPGSTLTIDGDVFLPTLRFFRSAPPGVTTTLEVHGGYLNMPSSGLNSVDLLVTGGRINDLEMGFNSQLRMTGGEAYSLTVADGGATTITGGMFDRGFDAKSGSYVEVSGGMIGARGGFLGESYIRSNAVANISDGAFGGRLIAYSGAQATITGGTFAEGLTVQAGATVSIANATIWSSLTTAAGTNVSIVNTSMGERSLLNDANIALAGQDVGVDLEANNVDWTMVGGAILDSPYFGGGSTVSLRGVAMGAEAVFDNSDLTIEGGSIGRGLTVRGPTSGYVYQTLLKDATVDDFALISRVKLSIDDGSYGYATSLSELRAGSTIRDASFGDNTTITGPVEIIGGSFGDNFQLNTGATHDSEIIIDGGSMGLSARIEGKLTLVDGSIGSGLRVSRSSSVVTVAGGADRFDSAIVTLTLFDGLLGDYNTDGVVDASDYTAWRDTLGDTVVPGAGADHDFSGVIDQGDYYVWRSHYGSSQSAPESVPESTSIALTVLMSLATGLLHHRHG